MQFSIVSTFITLVTVASALAAELPEMSAMRRDILLMERAGANANRPVPGPNDCCVANTSLKEDVCTTQAGQAGTCVPEGAQVNCQGALNCIQTSLLTCNAKVLENGRPTCRL